MVRGSLSEPQTQGSNPLTPGRRGVEGGGGRGVGGGEGVGGGGRGSFIRSSHTRDLKLGTAVAPSSYVTGSALGLVGSVSVCYNWVA